MRVRLATCAAKPDRANEDFAAAVPGAVVLLDGAGPPAGMPSGCVHGTAWYARTLGGLLLAEIQPGRQLAESLGRAIERVNALHGAACDLAHPGTPSATVAMARLQDGKLDHLVLADSVLVLDRKGADPAVMSDDRLAVTTRELRKDLDALPTGSAEHTAALRSFTEALAGYRNRPGGFWVASTDPQAADQALTGSNAGDELRALAVLSDGASRLVDRFGLLTWPGLLDVLRQDGAEALIARTRAAERDDPEGRRWPRGKTHDDATAIFWQLSD
ncbi:hypothetical protein Acsp03_22970 [Actinomadura sp. NBRC 104412]|uniref:protein phosphatase 2C domain-containing protein n=1 Tax=Actinomadura sp. NBRC 104412 TaxID=3032203 RepID=UPI0024A09617|nr:protein phosphatase 2C domain-containing protein [Actinomadura sp. NBRC 104412]GLZ04831.1 hypothetical protein Acsp03_22970 [Actinomadura sp. NBRC 104412]